MPTFQQLLDELNKRPEIEKQVEFIDSFRRQKIKEIKEITKRDVLVYFSDLKKNHPASAITWDDKTCFADIVEGLDKKGVDVIIHSPGGSAEATESIACMLREHFDHIRFIVPNMAKSAATMLALSGDEILMDDRSELGPIDPQIEFIETANDNKVIARFVPAQTIIDGFDESKKIIAEEGIDVLPAYLPLLNKYTLHLLQICENAKKLSEELVKDWLSKYMFKGDEKAIEKAEAIAKNLADHKKYLSHGRPIGVNEAKKIGIKVSDLRDNQSLRNKIWELYCVLEILLDRSPIIKLYENSNGVFLAKNIPFQQIMIPQIPQEQKTEK